MSTPAAKRFWTTTSMKADDGGFAVTLDGRDVKTPNGTVFRAPTEPLAVAIRDEWDAQVEVINPDAMPMFKFTVTAVDRVTPQRDAVVDELANYGANDLLCYREGGDQQLANHQDETWQPYLSWAEATLDVRLSCFVGIMPGEQSPEAKQALRGHVDRYSDFELSGLHSLVTVSGSLILGLAAAQNHQPIDAITKAAQLDELWQQEKWGYDDEAGARLKAHHTLMTEAHRYLSLLKT
ncbi:MAG: ATPase [Alphaproteobacteria bacterium]|nr:ATPase [Alphaproteobacteria bacterium]